MQGLSGLLQWGVRQWAELENSLTSVERLVEYSKVDKESSKGERPRVWPKRGKIEFKDLELRYVKNVEPILKKLNFTVDPGEKLGIIGRTGAGKSSIIYSLFRLYSVNGTILIDDVDVKKINLETLRKSISIIPQDPLIFSGTLRTNLDPYFAYSDEELWRALEDVNMKQVVLDLDVQLRENGSNYSIGQKQLICLARAILRKNKIIILDEATANVDQETDELIQKVIKKKFTDCTVLTIAHRLDNVIDCDKIMVMDNGNVVEFGNPRVLMTDEDGIFHKMATKTGLLIKETS